MKISLAYSPDTDDAFMVHAIKNKLVDLRGYEFSLHREDIQVLNDAALDGVYDITAISMAAYPSVSDKYRLMTIGSSIGDKFGPAIVCHPDSDLTNVDDLQGKRIAIPGLRTSAYFALQGLLGDFEPVPMHFLKIADAILDGQVDGGILIHELQLMPESQGLRRLGDLGTLWYERFQLPLPLGANAISRKLDVAVATELNDIYKASIQWAFDHREEAIEKAMTESTAEYDPLLGDKYISMYVNNRAMGLDPEVRSAFECLMKIGVDRGLCDNLDMNDAIFEG